MFLYYAPNAAHFPVQGKKEIYDEIIDELVTWDKPMGLENFTNENIIEIIEGIGSTRLYSIV